jgi:FkbM family methyltransferase
VKIPKKLILLNYIVKQFRGMHLGKKFPILWKFYNIFFCMIMPKKPFTFILDQNKFMVDPNEPLPHVRKWMQSYIMNENYEPETTSLVKKIVKNGDIAIDIGASIGYFSMTLSKAVGPTGKVYSFEPTREGFKYLCENRILNNAENIIAYNIAAWDKDEPVKMPKSSYATNSQWANGMPISDFLHYKGVQSVDFIKIDVDGAELWVLKGIEKLIKNSFYLNMIIEFYPKYIKAAGGNPQDVLDFLDRYFVYEVVSGDYGDDYWNYICKRKN